MDNATQMANSAAMETGPGGIDAEQCWLELRQMARTEFIGQTVSCDEECMTPVQQLSIDTLALPRADLIKIDVEGMELKVLHGAGDPLAADVRVDDGRLALRM